MAWDKIITDLFAGYTEDGTDMIIPIAALPELTATEADLTTGDSRKLAYAILERMREWLEDDLVAADRPTKMTISASNTAPKDGVYTRTFVVRFKMPTGPMEVADE